MVIDQLNIVFDLYSLYDQYGYNDDAMWVAGSPRKRGKTH